MHVHACGGQVVHVRMATDKDHGIQTEHITPFSFGVVDHGVAGNLEPAPLHLVFRE